MPKASKELRDWPDLVGSQPGYLGEIMGAWTFIVGANPIFIIEPQFSIDNMDDFAIDNEGTKRRNLGCQYPLSCIVNTAMKQKKNANTSMKAGVHTVPVLRKAIAVFEAIGRASNGASTKALALNLGISPTTCYRILQTFSAAGWLRSRGDGTFGLSLGLIPVLGPLLRYETLVDIVREPLEKLTIATGLTAKLSVRQGNDAVTIFRTQSPRADAVVSRVGSAVSLAIGSSGAVFLAALPDSKVKQILDAAPAEAWIYQKRAAALRRVRDGRRLGYFVDTGSFQPSIHTLSAPLYGNNRELISVVTLLGFPQDFKPEARVSLVRELKYTAGGCTQLIQGVAAVPGV